MASKLSAENLIISVVILLANSKVSISLSLNKFCYPCWFQNRIAKFKSNIEARFYTALAKQITDNVFGTDGLQQDSGTFTSPIGGEVVTWTTPSGTGNVVVTVTEDDGTVTTFTMPKEDNS